MSMADALSDGSRAELTLEEGEMNLAMVEGRGAYRRDDERAQRGGQAAE